jgi:pimeloyl-ACP methyl ester carboxylesterase
MHALAAVVMMTTVAALPHSRVGHGPAVVLVHGLNTDRHVWDDAARELAKTHTVIALDLPGHGGGAALKTVDIDVVARQIAATVRTEKAAPAVIVGHSLGGTIVGHVPLVDPTVARGIVIVDSSIAAPWTQQVLDELRAKLTRDREAALRGWIGEICKPEQLDRLMAQARKLPDETRLAYMTAVMNQPVVDGGRGIGVPVLLMATKLLLEGKKPRAEELAEAGYAHVPKLQVEYFAQSMHWLFWDEPKKFQQTLARFLAQVER